MLTFSLTVFLFTDPDLAIEVDLKREEEERNGRREFISNLFFEVQIFLSRNLTFEAIQKQGYLVKT